MFLLIFLYRIHHYNIEKQLDGMYMIQDGKRFAGPVELIEHHTQNLDGFITMPQHPCNRLPFQPPVAFRGMTYTDLENELLIKAESIKVKNTLTFHKRKRPFEYV